jgi:hypothetical protein
MYVRIKQFLALSDRRPVDRKREGTTWVGEALPSPGYIRHCICPSLYISIYLCTHRLDAYKLLHTTHALSSSMAHAGSLQTTIGQGIALHCTLQAGPPCPVS